MDDLEHVRELLRRGSGRELLCPRDQLARQDDCELIRTESTCMGLTAVVTDELGYPLADELAVGGHVGLEAALFWRADRTPPRCAGRSVGLK